MHGSYEDGLVQDTLVDLTGGAGEEINMRSAKARIDLASGKQWSHCYVLSNGVFFYVQMCLFL